MRLSLLLTLLFLCVSCHEKNAQTAVNDKIKMTDNNIPNNLKFDSEKTSVVKGFQEVVFSVSDLDAAIEFYQEATGWELVYRGQPSEVLASLWQLSDRCTVEEAVLLNPGDKEGYLRLVKFSGVEQVQIRSSARTWESGGIFDINTRCVDIEETFKTFQSAGWTGYSDPVRFQFGKFDVSEVAVQGPDGIVIATMQRFAPPLEGYPNMTNLSHIFNSTHICKDVEAARHFFIDQLGWKVYLNFDGQNRKNGPTVLGLPQNINSELVVPVYIVHPDGVNFGSVEFLKVEGWEGEDFSARAKPPNLGILMLRFPVADAAAYLAEIESRGVKVNVAIQEIEIAPYGKVKAFSVLSPDGVWIEFIEKI